MEEKHLAHWEKVLPFIGYGSHKSGRGATEPGEILFPLLPGREATEPGEILFPLLPSHQADWGLSGHCQSAEFEHLFAHQQVSHGTFTSIFWSIEQDRWMVLLELKDACLHMPIYQIRYKFLFGPLSGTQWCRATYSLTMEGSYIWTSHCCQRFTKILLPLVAHLHMEFTCEFPYLDDIFHAQASLSQVCLTHDASSELCTYCGIHCQPEEISSCPPRCCSIWEL